MLEPKGRFIPRPGKVQVHWKRAASLVQLAGGKPEHPLHHGQKTGKKTVTVSVANDDDHISGKLKT